MDPAIIAKQQDDWWFQEYGYGPMQNCIELCESYGSACAQWHSETRSCSCAQSGATLRLLDTDTISDASYHWGIMLSGPQWSEPIQVNNSVVCDDITFGADICPGTYKECKWSNGLAVSVGDQMVENWSSTFNYPSNFTDIAVPGNGHIYSYQTNKPNDKPDGTFLVNNGLPVYTELNAQQSLFDLLQKMSELLNYNLDQNNPMWHFNIIVNQLMSAVVYFINVVSISKKTFKGN